MKPYAIAMLNRGELGGDVAIGEKRFLRNFAWDQDTIYAAKGRELYFRMTKSSPLYFRQNIQIEPLVDQWYAWPLLIPPATVARNLTERHLKIMESYISAPQIHAAAVRNPKMLGGPFIDYGGERVEEIRALQEDTKRRRANLVELSTALTTLDNLLRKEAVGLSLHPLYARMPECLKGYVELVYDLNNNASLRLQEKLLYNSQYFVQDAQSLMLSEISGDDRPFVLSTPRLESANAIRLRAPFDHPVIDQVFRMKTVPQPIYVIREAFTGLIEESTSIERLFTPDAPVPYEAYSGKGIRWRYFGHACILIETNRGSVLVDPVLSYTYESGISRYTYQDLPERIDFILITHNHQDHVLIETLLQLRHKVGQIIVPRSNNGALQDPSLKLILQAIGFTDVFELSELETVEHEEFSITGLPFFGEHADLDVKTKLAYLLRARGYLMMFAADSCNVEPRLYEHLGRLIGPIDALFLGMECDGAPLTWLYGPLLTKRIDRASDESRRLSGCNFEQAIEMVERLKCRQVYVYAMGQEPWLNYVMSLRYTDESRPIKECKRLVNRSGRGFGLGAYLEACGKTGVSIGRRRLRNRKRAVWA